MRRLALRRRDGSICAHAIVDDADFEWASRWRWCLATIGYVVRRPSGRTVYLHRELLGLEPGDGLEGDHRNGDRLDNRRENLRIASHAENQQNRHYGWGTSLHRGVCWDKAHGCWRASAMLDGKRYYLGLFAVEEDAAEAAAAFRAKHMPFATAA